MNIKAQISKQAILNNYDVIAQQAGGAVIAPVIKADAYGLGAVNVVKILEEKSPKLYYVATLDEALEIRPETKADIVVFGGVQAGQEKLFVEHNITPALKSEIDVELWSNHAKLLDAPLPCQIHLDTAMNRTGVKSPNDDYVVKNISNIEIRYALSHFASSEERDNVLNAKQCAELERRAALYSEAYGQYIPRSMANSSAIFNFPNSHYDMVRPGGALWGVEMEIGQGEGLKPALSLEAKVLQVSEIKAGDSVGYNELFRADRTYKTATLAIGYADGLHWPASNSAHFYWRGRPCKVAGSVSMDLTTVLLPDDLVEDQMPKSGDYMELIGPHQRVEELAKSCGARAYEMQIALGSAKRVRKSYV